MATRLLQNMPSGHVKVKKGSGHVLYMSTPCNTTESVRIIKQIRPLLGQSTPAHLDLVCILDAKSKATC